MVMLIPSRKPFTREDRESRVKEEDKEKKNLEDEPDDRRVHG